MREIKFRAKEIATGVWRQLIISPFADSALMLNSKWDEEEFVDMTTLGQYTGLKDKNGVEIYEGDIIKFIVNGEIAICEYREDSALFSFCNVEKTLTSLYFDFKDETPIEVIGNIYENPELVEVETTKHTTTHSCD